VSSLRIAHPGQAAVLLAETVPVLTARQEQILHACRSFGGNRSRTARHLGVTVAAVQRSLGYAIQAGANVPPPITRRGIPNGIPREVGPRCGKPMRSGTCGRRAGHPPACINERAWARKRSPERTLFR
jgi:hypothetical protein